MAKLSATSMFQSWEMSPSEQLMGSILTTSQIQCIQNQIVQIAHEKMMLKFDPTNVLVYAQQEAELQGKLLALQYLISLSDEATKELDPGMSVKNFSGTPRETPPDDPSPLFPPLLPDTSIPPDDEQPLN